MRESKRVVLILGFLVLAVIALFPPRRATETGDLRRSFPYHVASRTFLFSDGIYEYVYAVPGGQQGIAAEVDVGRLAAEALLVVCLTGIVTVIVTDRLRSA